MDVGLAAALPLSGGGVGMMDIPKAHCLCRAWEAMIAAAQSPAVASA
jgi:hypothetical protein